MMDYLPKLIQLDELSYHGEPTIQIVRPHEFNKLAHVKAASEAMDYIKNVAPQPGKTIILVLAMTAGEFYGPNRNGDAWPERPLRVGPTSITEDQVLPNHYKTFEQHANVYRHHINKDPAKKIGDILKSFYNWPMHRVELLLALDNKKASDVVERIENGEFPAVSMGCKVKYDVCSICGNKAPNRAEYCDHARYQLGDTLPNGQIILVWNPSPRFFDLSAVRRPADRLGYMIKKVAEFLPDFQSSAALGEYVEEATRKVANLRKLSIINKVLRGQVGGAKTDDGQLRMLRQLGDQVARPAAESMPPLDDSTIRSLIQFRPAEVLSTLSSMGILLTTPEFIKFFVWKIDPTAQIPEGVLDRAVEVQGDVFRMLAENPTILDTITETGFVDTCRPNPVLSEKMGQFIEARSQHEDALYRRACYSSVIGLHTPCVYRDIPGTSKYASLVGCAALIAGAYTLRPPGSDAYALDVNNAMIKMAMDLAHRPRTPAGTVRTNSGDTGLDLTFEEAANRVGMALYL
jgi:hypothetical protein